jgi:steroid delta-isomerase-like uncharacterized protein
MTRQEIMAFVQRGYDAYNAHESDPHWLGYTDTDVAEECHVIDVPSGMILYGPEGLKQFLLTFSTAFPDSRGEVTAMFVGENHAVVEAILRGTHSGVMHSAAGDLLPTGRRVELRVCEIFQIKNGKITRHATYYDALGFMQQLGVIPAAG